MLFNCVEISSFSYIFPVLERWPVILAEVCLKFEIHHVSAIVIIHVNTAKYSLSTLVYMAKKFSILSSVHFYVSALRALRDCIP